jgi:class 3 adenylate cyclase
MTTENVAILFTDVVDSTQLFQSLSPEDADQVRREHFSILRQAIAEAGGAEVKNMGDGLMVVFASASAALSCGVAMQQGVERDNRGAEEIIGLRVGLSCGEVTAEDDDYFGDPVIEAARLCARCKSGEIMAADVVRLMAGRRNDHRCVSVGSLSLKGLPDPVETIEVAWEPVEGVGTASFPLPTRLAIRPQVGVVGRRDEAAAIASAFKRVAGGEGCEVALVSGEAGQGKTTVVAEGARAAFEEGAWVLFGHCEEDIAAPYQLFAETLGHYITHAPEDRLKPLVDAYGPELARVVPALAKRVAGLPPSTATDTESERYLLFAAVVEFIAQISVGQPIVLVLEDLQWADEGSLQLLRHLVAAELSGPVLVLGTYRDSELSHAKALVEALGALHRHSGVSRIALGGLDNAGVISFMEAASGQTLTGAAVGLAQAIFQETDGNPFFVGEVLRHLAETGAIYRDETGRWTTVDNLSNTSLPLGVREVIEARVVRLGREAEGVLSLAAVIGRDFDLDLLVAATHSTEDQVLDVLDASVAVTLVRELDDAQGRYSFAHALIQRTIYEDLGPTRRARAHRRVAEALEDLCGDRPGARVSDLARHWLNAAGGQNLEKALDCSRRAADTALESLAPEDALRYYTQALGIAARIPDTSAAQILDLTIGLGIAQRQVGNPDFRSTLLEAARDAADLGDTRRLVAAALANDRGFSALGSIDRDRIDILETALARLPSDHRDRALLLANLCKEQAGDCPLTRRIALSDEALAIAESSGDETAIVRVLNQVSLPLRLPPLLSQSLIRSADAVARAEHIGDPVLLFAAAAARSVIAVQAGDLDEVDQCIEIAGSLADQLGQPTLTWVHTIELATRSLISGDTFRAEQLADKAFQIGIESGQPDAALLFSTQYFGVIWQRGSLADAVVLIEQSIADNPGITALVAGLAMAHVEGGRDDDARQLLKTSCSPDLDAPTTGTWLTAMTMFAEVAIECRDAKGAKQQFQRLAPWASQFSAGAVTAEGPVSHYLGGPATVLGRYAEANVYFAQSAAFSDRVGAGFFAARTNLLWGRMLAERNTPGDLDNARGRFTKAHTVAEANGYGVVERRAAAALQALD